MDNTPSNTTTPAKTSTLAVLSLVFGILGVFFFGSLIAVVLGHLGRSEIQKSNGSLEGDGMAIAGLVLGYLMLLVSIGILVFFGGLAALFALTS